MQYTTFASAGAALGHIDGMPFRGLPASCSRMGQKSKYVMQARPCSLISSTALPSGKYNQTVPSPRHRASTFQLCLHPSYREKPSDVIGVPLQSFFQHDLTTSSHVARQGNIPSQHRFDFGTGTPLAFHASPPLLACRAWPTRLHQCQPAPFQYTVPLRQDAL